jgi:ABC-2 type transport system ATP-binding protein
VSTIAAHDLRKSFGRTTAVGGVSFSLEPGITGLLGPNGAGKTTLLRMLATVLAPDGGSLRLLGHDAADPVERVSIRRRLGYMPQEPGFHRAFTAFEFVDYIAVLKEMTDRRARHDEVRRVLSLVGLESVTRKRIRSLSGGMRRRVALAQALLGQPDLLVLDEPTAGLDPEQRLRFRELISAPSDGQTVVISTHQTEDVGALCHRVIAVDGGRTLFDGPPRALAQSARGQVWVSDGPAPGTRLSWRTGEGLHRHIGDAPAGADLVEPTIEDAYLLLVGAKAATAEAHA